MFALACVLGACASVPSGPYWEDQKWNESLFRAVQASVHYPSGTNGEGVLEAQAEPLQAQVQFTFNKDHLEDVRITQTTGWSASDHALLEQVTVAHVPPATGPYAGILRRFEFNLAMPTPMSEFDSTLQVALKKRVKYPISALRYHEMGAVVLEFDYADNAVSNPTISQTSTHESLDRAALDAVTGLIGPPLPAIYAGTHLHMKTQACFSLWGTPCPSYKEVIQVINPR